MPDSNGEIKGIAVPHVPWHETAQQDACPTCQGSKDTRRLSNQGTSDKLSYCNDEYHYSDLPRPAKYPS